MLGQETRNTVTYLIHKNPGKENPAVAGLSEINFSREPYEVC